MRSSFKKKFLHRKTNFNSFEFDFKKCTERDGNAKLSEDVLYHCLSSVQTQIHLIRYFKNKK